MRNSQTVAWIASLCLLLIFSSCRTDDEDLYQDPGDLSDGGSADFSGDPEEGDLTLYRISGDNLTKIQDYPVDSRYLSFQQDVAKHREMWSFTTTLFPTSSRQHFDNYMVFHGENQVLGYVFPNDNSLGNWTYGLDISHAYPGGVFNGDGVFAYTTVHEFGHILTLNQDQFEEHVTNASACSNYFTQACANSNSYINIFFDRFWADIYDEFQAIGDDYDAQDAFYTKYHNRFVTYYAASNPDEDIAESFSAFILESRPSGSSIADRKVQMFYEFPELVMLRNHVQANYQNRPPAKTSTLSAMAGRHRCVRHRH